MTPILPEPAPNHLFPGFSSPGRLRRAGEALGLPSDATDEMIYAALQAQQTEMTRARESLETAEREYLGLSPTASRRELSDARNAAAFRVAVICSAPSHPKGRVARVVEMRADFTFRAAGPAWESLDITNRSPRRTGVHQTLVGDREMTEAEARILYMSPSPGMSIEDIEARKGAERQINADQRERYVLECNLCGLRKVLRHETALDFTVKCGQAGVVEVPLAALAAIV